MNVRMYGQFFCFFFFASEGDTEKWSAHSFIQFTDIAWILCSGQHYDDDQQKSNIRHFTRVVLFIAWVLHCFCWVVPGSRKWWYRYRYHGLQVLIDLKDQRLSRLDLKPQFYRPRTYWANGDHQLMTQLWQQQDSPRLHFSAFCLFIRLLILKGTSGSFWGQ